MAAVQILALALAGASLHAQLPTRASNTAVADPRRVLTIVEEVRGASFPEIPSDSIQVRPFHSNSDYFQARFSLLRLVLLQKMHYVLRVNDNPVLQAAPQDALRAITAHELAHMRYYASGNRLRLLGLVRLSAGAYRRNFEREADLEAVHLGYASGLKRYRSWLYEHVPPTALPEKMRDYLSPAEIDAAASILAETVPDTSQHQ